MNSQDHFMGMVSLSLAGVTILAAILPDSASRFSNLTSQLIGRVGKTFSRLLLLSISAILLWIGWELLR